jgi:hypothetical protein
MASYPGSIVSFTRQVNCASPVIDEFSLDEDDVNLPYDEIEAIETELGTNPSGGSATVGTRIGLAEAGMMPIGAIIMWGGSYGSIPGGFSMCNGSNGTPNLQHKFVRCTSGTEAPGDTGGADSTTLSITHMPSHNHSGSSNATFNHTHSTDSQGLHGHTMKKEAVFQTGTNRTGVYQGGIGTYSPGDPCVNSGYHTHTLSYSGTHSHTITVGYKGSGTSFGNMPAYYELIYIQKTS